MAALNFSLLAEPEPATTHSQFPEETSTIISSSSSNAPEITTPTLEETSTTLDIATDSTSTSITATAVTPDSTTTLSGTDGGILLSSFSVLGGVIGGSVVFLLIMAVTVGAVVGLIKWKRSKRYSEMRETVKYINGIEGESM